MGTGETIDVGNIPRPAGLGRGESAYSPVSQAYQAEMRRKKELAEKEAAQLRKLTAAMARKTERGFEEEN